MTEVCAGEVVDHRFRVVRSIGSGGMASVYEVHEVDTGVRFAMKVLHRRMLLHPVIPQRFLREAQAASALSTPFAVKVEQTGNLTNGAPYIVMEYLEGQPLNAIIQRDAGRFDAERVLYLVDQVAQGIHDAHTRSIIHRDLKPENIFVIPTGQGDLVKVVDFGISKIFSADDGVKLTQTGVTVGTPQYMPVEQLRGTKDLDGRVDVYALGVVMYEMFAGVRPYDGFTYEEVILKVATSMAPPLSTYRSDLPPPLLSLVDRTMARDRNERVVSMAQLRQELAPFWSGRCPICGHQTPPATLNEERVWSQTGRQPPATIHEPTVSEPMFLKTGQVPAAAPATRLVAGHVSQPMNVPVSASFAVGFTRPTAGKTKVIEDPGLRRGTLPAPTISDHDVASNALRSVASTPLASSASGASASAQASSTSAGPSKMLMLALVILAAALAGVILVVGVVAIWLYLL